MLSRKRARALMFTDWESLFKHGVVDPREMLQDFYSFEKIPGVKENFNSWPLDLKHQVIRWFRQDMDTRSISVIIRLRSEVQAAHPDRDWHQSSLSNLADAVQKTNPLVNAEYMSFVDEFVESQTDRKLFEFSFKVEMNTTAVLLMSAVYPLELMREVMKHWMQNTASNQLHHFVELFEKWDELKGYPVDWSIRTFG